MKLWNWPFQTDNLATKVMRFVKFWISLKSMFLKRHWTGIGKNEVKFTPKSLVIFNSNSQQMARTFDRYKVHFDLKVSNEEKWDLYLYRGPFSSAWQLRFLDLMHVHPRGNTRFFVIHLNMRGNPISKT